MLGIHTDGTYHIIAKMITIYHLHPLDINHIDAMSSTYPHLLLVIFVETSDIFMRIWQNLAESSTCHLYGSTLIECSKPQITITISSCSCHDTATFMFIGCQSFSFWREDIQSFTISTYP